MATQTLYLASSVSGSAATPNDALGAPNGSTVANNLTGWAGAGNVNTSWTHRWRFTNPTEPDLAPTNQVMTIKVRKGSNTGNPSVTGVRVYQGGTQVYSDTTSRSITNSTAGQTFNVTWTGSGSSQNIDIEVVTSAVGGSGSARNAVMLDSVTWVAQTQTQIPNAPPVAVLAPLPTENFVYGKQYMLDGMGSYDPDGTITSYTFTQVSGPSVTLSGFGGISTFTVTSPGTYVFRLTVTDNAGLTSSTFAEQSMTLTEGLPPVAVVTASPLQGLAGETYQLIGDQSYDPDGTIVDYTWAQVTLVSPPAYVDLIGTGPNRQVVLPKPGKYDFYLVVTDNTGAQNSKVIGLTALPSPPVLVVEGGKNQTLPYQPGEHLLLDLSQSYDPDGSAVYIEVNFRDNENPEPVSAIEVMIGVWEYYVTMPGLYYIDVILTDSGGGYVEEVITLNFVEEGAGGPGTFIWEGGMQKTATLSVWTGGIEVPITIDPSV